MKVTIDITDDVKICSSVKDHEVEIWVKSIDTDKSISVYKVGIDTLKAALRKISANNLDAF